MSLLEPIEESQEMFFEYLAIENLLFLNAHTFLGHMIYTIFEIITKTRGVANCE